MIWLAAFLTVAGAGVLYLAWSRRDLRRIALPGGWGLVVAGFLAATLAMRADTGLAVNGVFLMTAVLFIIAAQGGRTLRDVKPAKAPRLREDEPDGLELGRSNLGRGYWGRVAVRTLGSLVAVPVAATFAGLLLYRFMAASGADRLMAGALVAMLAMAGLLIWLLASAKPWRTGAVITTVAVVLGAAAFLSRSL